VIGKWISLDDAQPPAGKQVILAYEDYRGRWEYSVRTLEQGETVNSHYKYWAVPLSPSNPEARA